MRLYTWLRIAMPDILGGELDAVIHRLQLTFPEMLEGTNFFLWIDTEDYMPAWAITDGDFFEGSVSSIVLKLRRDSKRPCLTNSETLLRSSRFTMTMMETTLLISSTIPPVSTSNGVLRLPRTKFLRSPNHGDSDSCIVASPQPST